MTASGSRAPRARGIVFRVSRGACCQLNSSPMVGPFYDAKCREQVQRQSAYTQAIRETGAQGTLTVKDLRELAVGRRQLAGALQQNYATSNFISLRLASGTRSWTLKISTPTT
jgi:hypothetical protein